MHLENAHHTAPCRDGMALCGVQACGLDVGKNGEDGEERIEKRREERKRFFRCHNQPEIYNSSAGEGRRDTLYISRF